MVGSLFTWRRIARKDVRTSAAIIEFKMGGKCNIFLMFNLILMNVLVTNYNISFIIIV